LNATSDWRELLRQPRLGDHVVQVYQDDEFLEEAVSGYLRPGLAAGEAAIVIAVPEHRARFASLDPAAVARGQMVLFDAEETLGTFMRDGLPDPQAFHRVIGGAIAKLRLEHPAVRAYGEMVDVLWQRGSREAAIRLEEQWNQLLRLQTFTLLCAYRMDPLDAGSYGGPLESICGCHSHFIPARDYAHLDEAVAQAARDALDEGLAGMLLSLAAKSHPGASMPLGQAALLWLKRNMPLTAEKVLAGVRARC
jgi:hypothetical protein